nr:heme-binding domain-containing protein [Ardenticatena sp.]
MMRILRRLMQNWKRLVVAGVGLFVLIQFIPYGREHTNLPVVQEPAWDSPQTRELARRACFDCHSNETVWPWYSNVAPVSWLIQRDVDEGRQKLNFSEWNRPQDELDEITEVVREGEMPPMYYVLLHPQAKLSQTEKEALIAGLRATVRQSPPGR